MAVGLRSAAIEFMFCSESELSDIVKYRKELEKKGKIMYVSLAEKIYSGVKHIAVCINLNSWESRGTRPFDGGRGEVLRVWGVHDFASRYGLS